MFGVYRRQSGWRAGEEQVGRTNAVRGRKQRGWGGLSSADGGVMMVVVSGCC